MPQADFFARLGLFVVRNFFGAEVCAELVADVRAGAGTAAEVRKAGTTYEVDEDYRRAHWVKVSAEARSLVNGRLKTVTPALASHFHVALAGFEPPLFLAYREGGFYRPHRDCAIDPTAPPHVQQRRVSVVVFLNGEAEGPAEDAYSGGALTFYGLLPDPRLKLHGLPLQGEAGLLVAFRSDLFHEVQAVTGGERYTIVSWFFSDGDTGDV
jgi:SM-20-related protein